MALWWLIEYVWTGWPFRWQSKTNIHHHNVNQTRDTPHSKSQAVMNKRELEFCLNWHHIHYTAQCITFDQGPMSKLIQSFWPLSIWIECLSGLWNAPQHLWSLVKFSEIVFMIGCHDGHLTLTDIPNKCERKQSIILNHCNNKHIILK